MTRLSGADQCHIKFGTTFDMRSRFAAACDKVGVSQAKVLKTVVEEWVREIETVKAERGEADAD